MILELLSYIIVAVGFGLYYYFRGLKDGRQEEKENYLNNKNIIKEV